MYSPTKFEITTGNTDTVLSGITHSINFRLSVVSKVSLPVVSVSVYLSFRWQLCQIYYIGCIPRWAFNRTRGNRRLVPGVGLEYPGLHLPEPVRDSQ